MSHAAHISGSLVQTLRKPLAYARAPFLAFVFSVSLRSRNRKGAESWTGTRELLLQYVDKYKLGYEVTALDSVELPAYDGPVRLVSAQQAGR